MQIKSLRAEEVDKSSPYSRDGLYLKMAKIWSENSYCERNQVGCLIVKNGAIVSDGYNGTPHGFPNVCETTEGETHPYVLHAEANAISKIAKSNNSSEGSTIYITLSPCYECAKLIIQSGIKKVVFAEFYRKTESLELLQKAGIEILNIII
jgi:dCMP deaminase